MTQAETGTGFKTTQWSMVLAAPDDTYALEQLLKVYWGPIYAYIRRTGTPRDSAVDLTQDFIARVMLERGLIQRADPERGRFRSFLKAAIRNFLTDQHRRQTTRDRAPLLPIAGGNVLEVLEPATDDDPSAAFDRQWAATLLSTTLDRVETECAASKQEAHWAAFKAAVIDPALGASPPPALDAVAHGLGLGSAEQVSSMIQTVRRKFRRTLHELVEQTLADPGEAGEELGLLRGMLAV